jgi:ribosome-associated toxin RatA of RatAB toxin-antitoxin module
VKDLRGDATATVTASASECFALLTAIEGYPEWHPEVVRWAEVTGRDALRRPTRAKATVHLGIGPLTRDFRLDLEVTTVPDRLVRLERIPHGSSDPEQFTVEWKIEPDQDTRLTVELRASLSVPRLLPVQGVGDSVARGFLEAARTELELRRG